MRRITTLLLLVGILLGINNPARAEAEVRVDVEVSHIFGQEITIQGKIETENQIQDLRVFIQSENDAIVTESIPFSEDGEISYTLDVTNQAIRAFSYLTIWFDVQLENDEIITTPALDTYYYDDNRFDWQSASAAEFTIHWYQPDNALGQKILNAANEGLQRIQNQIDVPRPQHVDIYAYSSAVDMQGTLAFSGQTAAWIAGHADPDLDLIVVSLPPGPDQTLEIRRQIPHELVHVLLYQKLGSGYQYLPRWLNEGLASTAELFPNPDYEILLSKAYERESLIPLDELCSSFPLDAASFQLSYAESYDFTWYLSQTYGKTKVDELIQTYADGRGCEQGIETALGTSLKKLNNDWRELKFGENMMLKALNIFAPWIFLAVIVLAAPVGWMVSGLSRKKARTSQSGSQP